MLYLNVLLFVCVLGCWHIFYYSSRCRVCEFVCDYFVFGVSIIYTIFVPVHIKCSWFWPILKGMLCRQLRIAYDGYLKGTHTRTHTHQQVATTYLCRCATEINMILIIFSILFRHFADMKFRLVIFSKRMKFHLDKKSVSCLIYLNIIFIIIKMTIWKKKIRLKRDFL